MSFIITIILLNSTNKTKALTNHSNDYTWEGGVCIKNISNAQRIDYTNFTSLTDFSNPKAHTINNVQYSNDLNINIPEGKTYESIKPSSSYNYDFVDNNTMVFQNLIYYQKQYYNVEVSLLNLYSDEANCGWYLTGHNDKSEFIVGTTRNDLTKSSSVRYKVRIINSNSKELADLNNLYITLFDLDRGGSFRLFNGMRDGNIYYDYDENTIFKLDNVSYNSINKEFYAKSDNEDEPSYVFVPIENEFEFGYSGKYSTGELIKILFYMENNKVNYFSDENGCIEGLVTENVAKGNNPIGTNVKPMENYETKYWICDKDVFLLDGHKINNGNPIYDITQIIVNEDINLTAINSYMPLIKYESDEGGIITGISEERISINSMPSGTTDEIIEDYEYYDTKGNNNWTCDKDVLVENSNIDSGSYISIDEVKKVNSVEDMTFTVHHVKVEPNYEDENIKISKISDSNNNSNENFPSEQLKSNNITRIKTGDYINCFILILSLILLVIVLRYIIIPIIKHK